MSEARELLGLPLAVEIIVTPGERAGWLSPILTAWVCTASFQGPLSDTVVRAAIA
jgi:hypothetical protein